jgi:hypothetical protein
MIEKVAWDKSGSLLNIQMKNAQMLQLFSMDIKTERSYKGY